MTEAARVERNRQRLQECHGSFRRRLALVLAELQAQGFRPRIQTAWRSSADQDRAYRDGNSELRWGFHNASGLNDEPEALAADVLDDDRPLEPSRGYLLALARAARKHGLDTGIDWGLPDNVKAALNVAIEAGQVWDSKLGWDGTHVQCTGITVREARAGKRPEGLAA